MAAGDRIALIGANGSGKTTLLDILAGEIAPESGSITKQRNVTMGYLKQDPGAFTNKPLLQEVLDADSEVNALLEEIGAAQAGLVIGNRLSATGLSLGPAQRALR